MNTELTLNILQNMTPDGFEEFRAAGEDIRRQLTHAVMRKLECPDGWAINGEYRSEFGGFFPVQIRFTPAHGHFCLALCSPGEISPVWTMVFIPSSGRPFSVIRTLITYSPEVISHTLKLTAMLNAEGYSYDNIIRTLSMEGAL